MLLKELEKMQRELDMNIIANLNKREHLYGEEMYLKEDFLTEALLALNTEIAEFLDTRDDKDRLEELVDVLHFVLSVKDTLQLKSIYDNSDVIEIMHFSDKCVPYTDLVLGLIIDVGKLANLTRSFKYWSTKWNKFENKGNIEKQFDRMLISYFSIPEMLYSAEIIQEAYLKKYEKNLKRQVEKY